MVSCILITVVMAAGLSCTPNQRIVDSAKTPEPTATGRPQPTGFEAALETMRTADYKYIYVFRRKDGAALDNDDKKFINSQKPVEVNRVRLSDEGRAVIFGSNFRLPPEVLKNLTDIYAFEDYSKTDNAALPPANSASNSAQ
jgi:hypothetical protein